MFRYTIQGKYLNVNNLDIFRSTDIENIEKFS